MTAATPPSCEAPRAGGKCNGGAHLETDRQRWRESDFFSPEEAHQRVARLDFDNLYRAARVICARAGLGALKGDLGSAAEELVHDMIVAVCRDVGQTGRVPWFRHAEPKRSFLGHMERLAKSEARKLRRRRVWEGPTMVETRELDGEQRAHGDVSADPGHHLDPQSILIAVEDLALRLAEIGTDAARMRAEDKAATGLSSEKDDALALHYLEITRDSPALRGKEIRERLGLDQKTYDSLLRRIRRRKDKAKGESK